MCTTCHRRIDSLGMDTIVYRRIVFDIVSKFIVIRGERSYIDVIPRLSKDTHVDIIIDYDHTLREMNSLISIPI